MGIYIMMFYKINTNIKAGTYRSLVPDKLKAKKHVNQKHYIYKIVLNPFILFSKHPNTRGCEEFYILTAMNNPKVGY